MCPQKVETPNKTFLNVKALGWLLIISLIANVALAVNYFIATRNLQIKNSLQEVSLVMSTCKNLPLRTEKDLLDSFRALPQIGEVKTETQDGVKMVVIGYRPTDLGIRWEDVRYPLTGCVKETK